MKRIALPCPALLVAAAASAQDLTPRSPRAEERRSSSSDATIHPVSGPVIENGFDRASTTAEIAAVGRVVRGHRGLRR